MHFVSARKEYSLYAWPAQQSGEARTLAELPPEVQREHFFALWTLKEAYIKARGEGIYLGLNNFSFTLDESLPDTARITFASPNFDNPEGWQFLRSNTLPHYPAAVALKDLKRRYRLELHHTDEIEALLDQVRLY